MPHAANDVAPQMPKKKIGLPLAPDAGADIEAELLKFEAEERSRLGLADEHEQWIEESVNLAFTKGEREKWGTTILVCGLTMAHDHFVEGAIRGLGYNVLALDAPDNEALRYGKEFGNRGQCNPTYFTVGNLVKFLSKLRDKGMTSEEIVHKYVFLTAGACGPCRFGMYVTEYRKALRDAGFDGFRVLLFQQTGGFAQATGEELGLEMAPPFFIAIVKGLLAGDVVNLLAYKIRPYELEAGATDAAVVRVKKTIYDALLNKKSIVRALWSARREFDQVKVDKLLPKPRVAIIGEFWAMTTEGDGNYQLQRFLEGEGAECDVQILAAWLCYNLWEARNDLKQRMLLRGTDDAKKGLKKTEDNGITAIVKKQAMLEVAEIALRSVFQGFAWLGGLHGYSLPNMDEIAELAHRYYNNDLRGGEGHMEVGKLILNVTKSKAHMTLSVKPFGCMPSAGVSDGVQSLITELHPGTIYCPVETSGDGRVNFYSRVQMFLFKAKIAAIAERDTVLAKHGVTLEQVQAFLAKNPKFAAGRHKSPHAAAGTAGDLIAEVAPFITTPAWKRAIGHAKDAASRVVETGPKMVTLARELRENAPELALRIKEDVAVVREVVSGKIATEWFEIGQKLMAKHDAVHEAHERVGTVVAAGGLRARGHEVIAAE
ncbi:MAG: 2-hydroxyglutaryl-CoA dehydratase [Polyangiales bacterium]